MAVNAAADRVDGTVAQPAPMRVLVAESIGASGPEALEAAGLAVDTGIGWTRDHLEARIALYAAIVVRSATQVDADLIGRATRLRVIARAGVGVDNIDLAAATRRGVIVINAPR